MPTRYYKSCIDCRWNNASCTSWPYWPTRHDRRQYRSIWAATSRHVAVRGHCDRHQLHYWKFLSDERLSPNVPSALQRHLSGTLCQHLFWTVILWRYLKLDLKLIFSLLFLPNWLDLSTSASEAIAPRSSTNHVLLLLLLCANVAAVVNWWLC